MRSSPLCSATLCQAVAVGIGNAWDGTAQVHCQQQGYKRITAHIVQWGDRRAALNTWLLRNPMALSPLLQLSPHPQCMPLSILALSWPCREEGMAGLWKGLGPNIARNAIINAAELASYDQIKVSLLETGAAAGLGRMAGGGDGRGGR